MHPPEPRWKNRKRPRTTRLAPTKSTTTATTTTTSWIGGIVFSIGILFGDSAVNAFVLETGGSPANLLKTTTTTISTNGVRHHRRIVVVHGSSSSSSLVAEISTLDKTAAWKENQDHNTPTTSRSIDNVPPWLSTHSVFATSTITSEDTDEETDKERHRHHHRLIQEEWELLQMELEEEHGWNDEDIQTTMEALSIASTTGGENTNWMLGCFQFLRTLLTFPELSTPPVVLASILHYFECVLARQSGIYEAVRERLLLLPGRTSSSFSSSSSMTTLALPFSYPTVIDTDLVQDTTSKTQVIVATTPVDRRKQKRVQRRKHRRKLKQQLYLRPGHEFLDDMAGTALTHDDDDDDSTAAPFSEEVLQLARAASQIKRAEIISEVILSASPSSGKRRLGGTGREYDELQNLLVSVGGEDWRALAIRCIASLYRLQEATTTTTIDGNVDDPSTQSRQQQRRRRQPELIATARSAMQVYAPLAERMGLHVLKTQLENKAFYHLYPRQYKAAITLFEHQGDSMKSVEQYLQQQIWYLLHQDPNLKQVDWQVTARVKGPFSLWKKLLRKSIPGTMYWMLHPRDDGVTTASIRTDGSSRSPSSSKGETPPTSDVMQSMLQIRDGVALRIIVQSRPIHGGESDSDRRNRDRLACYYVHQLIRSVFPESHPGHVKDYIANPKPNGYQSLHHTSTLRMNQSEIPFEIQVRSQDMHRVAEFGIAAHWEYKQVKAKQSTIVDDRTSSSATTKRVSGTTTDLTQTVTSSSALTTIRSYSPSTVTVLDHDETPSPTSSIPSAFANPVPINTGSSTPYLQALELARQSLVESSVFVFVAGTTTTSNGMEHGQLVSVKKGERVVDLWNQIFVQTTKERLPSQRQRRPSHKNSPSKLPTTYRNNDNKNIPVTVWRNGRLAEMNETIQNGDVLLFQQQEGRESLMRPPLSSSSLIVMEKEAKALTRPSGTSFSTSSFTRQS